MIAGSSPVLVIVGLDVLGRGLGRNVGGGDRHAVQAQLVPREVRVQEVPVLAQFNSGHPGTLHGACISVMQIYSMYLGAESNFNRKRSI